MIGTSVPEKLRRPAALLALAALAQVQLHPQAQAQAQVPAQAQQQRQARGVATVATDGGPQFLARREHPLPSKPEGLLATDLDGDGRSELFAVTQDPGVLHALSGSCAGRSWAVGTYPLAPERLTIAGSTAAAIAVASRGDNALRVINPLAAHKNGAHGNGAQDKAAPDETAQGGAAPDAELWRLDLDHTPRALASAGGHLAVACDGRELVLIDEERTIQRRELPADLPRCALMLASRESVIVGFQDTRGLHAFSIDDSDTSTWSADLGGIPRDLVEADLDGDGDLELACLAGDRSLWVFGWGAPGGGIASFAEAQALEWRTQAVPYSLNSFKAPGGNAGGSAGSDRLVMVHASDLAWLVLGDFSSAGPLLRHSAYAGQTPRGSATGDFDGDGFPDFAIANRDSLAISILRGTPTPEPATPGRHQPHFFSAPRTAVGGFPNSIAAGDLDGDGLPEVLVLNSKDDTLSVLPNHYGIGSPDGGGLGQALTIPAGPSPRAVASADLNADGRGDAALILIDGTGSRLRLFLGQGAGSSLRLEPAAADFPLGRSGSDLLLLDLDRDGDVDLMAVDPLGNLLVWWTQEPQGIFTEAGRLSVPGGPRAMAALGARTGAGASRNRGPGADAPLLALALSGPGEPRGVALLEVRPRGERGEAGLELVPVAHIQTDGSPQDIVAADVNGDGYPDLALLSRDAVGSPRGNLRLLLAREGGGFEQLPAAPTSMEPRTLLLADPNADGLTDLFVSAQFSHVINVWTVAEDRNARPSGLLRRPHLGAGVGCLDLVSADINGDGRPDIAVANAHTDDVSVLLAE